MNERLSSKKKARLKLKRGVTGVLKSLHALDREGDREGDRAVMSGRAPVTRTLHQWKPEASRGDEAFEG